MARISSTLAVLMLGVSSIALAQTPPATAPVPPTAAAVDATTPTATGTPMPMMKPMGTAAAAAPATAGVLTPAPKPAGTAALTTPTPAPRPVAATIFADIPANEDLASKLIGLDIHNAGNDKIGTIKDVAFGPNGIKAYIVGVGGFLGMGDHYVAIVPSAVKIGYDGLDKKWHASMNTTAADLKAAPEYKYASNS